MPQQHSLRRSTKTEYKNIEMMMHPATKISNVEDNHSIDIKISKVDKSVLISLPNIHYQSLCSIIISRT